MPTWGSLYFQNSSSPVMEQMIFFHDHSMLVMVMILVLVGYILMSSYWNSFYNLKMIEGQELESVWTVLPALFLVVIALPSIRLLYLMEEFDFAELTIKILGHQWFWSYEYSDMGFMSFDSYMVKDSSVFRLLNVDNCLMIPLKSDIRMIVSSSDVIHSWTIPSLGVKVDAIPGRLNQLSYMFNRVGVFMGQCSEICGANHSFMPIMILVLPQKDFVNSL
uniref:Cytochrome c oxidase subunit 2 n=1 Tax=Tetragnatha maxillosa TaxID=216284 RepID=A0A0A0YUS8_9ARAC|nr:cytochrome c oxidase subunit II [Tetragnatha maxillosa]AIX11779.1 cytochrome c oxidase subunit II [Tetragnatha maxillosa]AKG65069.1 cytochrome c oxidase subunit II [Tetragnatha maxillosa]